MSAMVAMILAYTVAIPAMAGAYWLYRGQRGVIAAIHLLFISSLVFECLATVGRVYFHNNLIVLSASVVVEAWFISYFIGRLLPNFRIFPIVPLIITALALVELYARGIAFLNITYTVKNLAVIIGLGMWFRWVSYNDSGLTIFRICGVLLFYHLTNFVFFIFLSTSLDTGILMFMIVVHNYINAICNLLFGYILWKQSTKSLLSA